ncbi:MAG: hypothetical protein C0501_02930 [Isosphaera sp.]|nr:hypothetical protein [Isosphaera sp.]
MARTIGVPALAVAAGLAWGGGAAADDGPVKAGFGTTMTLGGQGTAAQAAAADDTELTGYRRYYGGYYGGFGYGGYGFNRGFYPGFGGFGYRGFSPGFAGYGFNRGFGYGGFYPGYYGGFRPAFYTSYYSRSFYPYYGGFGGFYNGFGYGFGNGFYCGISGTKDDLAAPVVSLGLKVANNPTAAREPAPAAPADGTFRYDGGPANPVPLPAPEARPAPAGLPVSLPKATPARPYTYKAYGEK